jgi:hypothetical protein
MRTELDHKCFQRCQVGKFFVIFLFGHHSERFTKLFRGVFTSSDATVTCWVSQLLKKHFTVGIFKSFMHGAYSISVPSYAIIQIIIWVSVCHSDCNVWLCVALLQKILRGLIVKSKNQKKIFFPNYD